MSKPGQYDEDPELVRILQDRFKERALRKAEYRKMISDPYRWAFEAAPVDMGILRFEAQRTFAGTYKFFRPTPYNFLYQFCIIWLPIFGFSWATKRHQDKKEQKLRRGEVAYKDREDIHK